jgi:hypothetical protein
LTAAALGNIELYKLICINRDGNSLEWQIRKRLNNGFLVITYSTQPRTLHHDGRLPVLQVDREPARKPGSLPVAARTA